MLSSANAHAGAGHGHTQTPCQLMLYSSACRVDQVLDPRKLPVSGVLQSRKVDDMIM